MIEVIKLLKEEIEIQTLLIENRDKTIKAQKEIIRLRDEIIVNKDRLLTKKEEAIKELKLELKAVGDFVEVMNV
tara:strand:- start:75 stop:296 length:222 start_codon:yes stop_codon:yes gene_type:complete